MTVASSLLEITPQRISATPGAPLAFDVAVTNATRSLRYLDIRQVGMEGAIVRTIPETIQVPPEGTAHVAVTVDLPFVTPGETSFGFELRDLYTGDLFAYGDVDLQVDDISTARLEMLPTHLSGLSADTATVTITNTGETPLDFVMRAEAPDTALTFEFDPPQFGVPPAASQETALTIHRKTKWFGAPATHVFDVHAFGSNKAIDASGQFRQTAVFPPLLFKILATVLLFVVAIVVLIRVGSRIINDTEPYTWVELATPLTADGGRYGHTAVWVDFKPLDQPTGLAARWEWLVDWTFGRSGKQEAMVVWGGADDAGHALGTGAMYSVQDQVWASITDANNPPAPRAGHGAVWTGDRMVIWGGQTNDGSVPASYGDQFDPQRSEWTPLPPAEFPAGRRGHRTMKSLEGRRGHTTVWTGSELLVFGGETFNGAPLADGAVLRPDHETGDLADGAWSEMATFPGDARSFHASAWTGEYLVVFGGFTATGVSPELARDAYAYQVDRNRWWDITLNPAPSGRACHQAVFSGEEVIFLGGIDADDLTRAIDADDRIALDPGFQGLCRIAVATTDVDPTAWSLVVTPGADEISPPEFDWVQLTDAPQRLANRFSALWTGQEVTVVQPIEELDTDAAVRYVPGDGFEALPIPRSEVLGLTTDFTTVWINGGLIVFGGRDATRTPTNEGALLVLPDR